MTDYHGKTTSYSYYPTGQISGLTAPGSKVWSYYYNDIGQITQYAHPNGTTTNYGYDGQHRLASIQHMDGGNILDSFAYSLDTSGNITMTSHQDGSFWNYAYDSGNRLTLAQRRTDQQAILKQFDYTYDLADNMLSKLVYVPGSGTTTYVFTYNDGNEAVNQVVNGSLTTNFTYDEWGRTLSKVRDGSTSESYTYRYGGKLYSVTTNFPANSNSTYEYRGDGRMYSRTNGGTTTRFNYGRGWQVLTEEATNGTLQMSYVHDFTTPTGLVLADIAGTDPATGTARYYYHDNIDSTRRLRDANKASLAQYEFDPYGLYYAVSGVETPYKWGPYRLDRSNSMYYTPNRWYVPMQGKWLTDPLGMADGLVYAYAGNHPIGFNDPLGLSVGLCTCVCGAVGSCGLHACCTLPLGWTLLIAELGVGLFCWMFCEIANPPPPPRHPANMGVTMVEKLSILACPSACVGTPAEQRESLQMSKWRLPCGSSSSDTSAGMKQAYVLRTKDIASVAPLFFRFYY